MTDTEATVATGGEGAGTDDKMGTRPGDETPSVTPFSEMGEEERQSLLATLSNPAWWDDEDRTLGQPSETVSFLATITCDGHLADCVPAVRRLEGRLEAIPMGRIRDLLFDMYDVDEQTRNGCRRMAEERLSASRE